MAASNGNGTTEELRKRSVTAHDYEALGTDGSGAAPYFFFMAPYYGSKADEVLPISAPPYGTRARDTLLRSLTLAESMWASAVYKAATRIASFGWNIKDATQSARLERRASDLLHGAGQGEGWVTFILKVLKDYLGTDNGAFVEIVRATDARGSRVLGVQHLDSLRCWRTGDPAIPVVYEDLMGRHHILRDYQVMTFADMPSADLQLRGIGQCAASRAYNAVVKLQYLERYITEKLCGKALAVYFVNGIGRDQLANAMAQGNAQAVTEGFVRYMGVTVIPTVRPEAPEVSKIDLAGLPDRVDVKQERSAGYLIYANAIGMPVQEIEPLSGQGLGTGTQTVVLSEASQGQGLAAFVQQWEHKASRDVCPRTTTFAFANVDDKREQRQQAEITQIRAATRKVQIEIGELTVDEARQLAAEAGDIDKTFIAAELTPGSGLSDNDKALPATDEPDAGAAPPPPDEASPAVAAVLDSPALQEKAVDVEALMEAEAAYAERLARRLRGKRQRGRGRR